MDRIIMTMLTQYSLLEPQCNDQDHVLKVSSILKMGECRMNSQLEQGAKKKHTITVVQKTQQGHYQVQNQWQIMYPRGIGLATTLHTP
jgi:hypothetical protein